MDHGIIYIVVSMGLIVPSILVFLVVSEENRRVKGQATNNKSEKKMQINLIINGQDVEFNGTKENLETLLDQDKVSFQVKEGTWQEFRQSCESAGFFIAREELKSSHKGNYYVRNFECGCHVHHRLNVKNNWTFCPEHSFTDVVLALS